MWRYSPRCGQRGFPTHTLTGTLALAQERTRVRYVVVIFAVSNHVVFHSIFFAFHHLCKIWVFSFTFNTSISFTIFAILNFLIYIYISAALRIIDRIYTPELVATNHHVFTNRARRHFGFSI